MSSLHDRIDEKKSIARSNTEIPHGNCLTLWLIVRRKSKTAHPSVHPSNKKSSRVVRLCVLIGDKFDVFLTIDYKREAERARGREREMMMMMMM